MVRRDPLAAQLRELRERSISMTKKETIIVDGSAGEGGGQILRSSLALSLVTGKPFVIDNIRAGRAKPGLLRQHLTALSAATQIGNAKVEGAAIGSGTVSFSPRAVVPGDYRFAVGTAGSATLVLQTVLPALITASGPSTLVLEGGTHNPSAPPFDFIQKTFLPILNRLGPRVEAHLERYGFFPAGGGRFCVSIKPVRQLSPIELFTRGEARSRRVRLLLGALPRAIAERERAVMQRKTTWPDDAFEIVEIDDSNTHGPGNVILIECEHEHITETFVAFGERQLSGGIVAERAVSAARAWLAAGVPVGRHLADQLLLPFALAGGGAFATMPLSRHSHTNMEVIRKFLDVEFTVEEAAERTCVVKVG